MIPRATKSFTELLHIWGRFNLFWGRLIPNGSSKASNYIKSDKKQKLSFYCIAITKQPKT